MEITRRKFMLGAGAVLATTAFAAEGDAGGKPTPGGVKRFEFGEDGTFTFLMIADWHRRTGKSNTAREIAVFRKAVARFRPALVVFGGDNVSGGTGGSKRGVFEKLMEPVMAEFKATGTSLCIAFATTIRNSRSPTRRLSRARNSTIGTRRRWAASSWTTTCRS